jgi:hypothetical protein
VAKVAKIKGIEEAKLEIMRQTQAEMPAILTTFADECMRFVWDRWPAKTGRSIEHLVVDAASGIVSIACPESYASNIYVAGERGSALVARLLPAINDNINVISQRASQRILAGDIARPGRGVPAGLVAAKIAESKAREKEMGRKRMSVAEARDRDKLRKRAARARKKAGG